MKIDNHTQFCPKESSKLTIFCKRKAIENTTLLKRWTIFWGIYKTKKPSQTGPLTTTIDELNVCSSASAPVHHTGS